MGTWIISNCSSSLRFEHLPLRVRQGTVFVVRCYLPLKQTDSAPVRAARSSEQETWWLCDCNKEHPELSKTPFGPFRGNMVRSIACLWVPQVRVPQTFPQTIPWPDALRSLPFRVFQLARRLYEWNTSDGNRGKRRRINLVREQMDVLAHDFRAHGVPAVHPRVESRGSLSNGAQTRRQTVATCGSLHALVTMNTLSGRIGTFLKEETRKQGPWPTWDAFITESRTSGYAHL